MLLKYFYDQTLAQASYLVGCQACGEALIIDPARDIKPYLQAAEQEGFQITHVAETHIHADFVSGSRELAHAAGARLWLSVMGDDYWQYAFADTPITPARDGEAFMVGNIKVEILHTPGHTPEHLVFQITDTAGADRPMGIFTGDFLFVGDIGRPDLLETAAGIANTKEIGARQQFHNIQHFKSLPDYLQIWPGHGAGSACGKALGAVPSTTLGYEKLFNPAFQIQDENSFVEWLLDGQPEPPRYFAHMKTINRVGPPLLETLPPPVRLTAGSARWEEIIAQALVIDTRPAELFANEHLPGTLHVPGNNHSFSTYVGWYVDYQRPVYLIAAEEDLPRLLNELRAIGVDNIPHYLTPQQLDTFGQLHSTPQLTPQQAHALAKNDAQAIILDVRNQNEYAEERIAGAQHIPMGFVPQRLATLPKDKQIIVQCGSGVRSPVVASLLQQHGFKNIANMRGGISAWRAAGLPVE